MTKNIDRKPRPVQVQANRPPVDHRDERRSGLNIAYVIISALVICSMLAVAISQLDLGSLTGRNDQDLFDPNANVISTQEAVVRDNPEDVDALVLLANFYANSDRVDDALKTFEKAVELAPEDANVRYEYGRALQSHDYPDDAETQFLKALELDPNNQNVHYYLAELYMSMDPPRPDDAYDHYVTCVQINPNSFRGERAQAMLDTWGQSTPVASPTSEAAG